MNKINQFIIEGLDRLGKDTLINGIQNRLGFHQVLHYSKPELLDCYLRGHDEQYARLQYQYASFRAMFKMLNSGAPLILNRSHLGEATYANLYRGYDGDYVFGLEEVAKVQAMNSTRLILLTEDFRVSDHFKDDGLSLGPVSKRAEEQQLFIRSFNKSAFADKRIICVTDQKTGAFKDKNLILDEVLA
jgi:thymidylate kinase